MATFYPLPLHHHIASRLDLQYPHDLSNRRHHQKEDILEFSELAPLISTIVSLASLAIVLVELRRGRQQNKISSMIQVYDTNRELVSLGFNQPELFQIIGDDSRDGGVRRRYLQLWLNQIALIYRLEKHNLFSPEQWESMEHDILDFMQMATMKAHWEAYRKYYPKDLQEFVENGLQQNIAEAPAIEAPATSSQDGTT